MALLRSLQRASTAVAARRYVSTAVSPLQRFFKVSDEVRAAITAQKPVVALESTIYTHGFPYPENVKLAEEVEAVVRKHGAVPATIAVLDGVCQVGLSPAELKKMAEGAGKKDTVKVSRRDIPYLAGMKLVGKNLNGGTTIAGTMIFAQLAGIKVFATGGLGGVHRGAEQTMDISADLTELGRTNVAVISSGAKAFLDLEKTLEYLETQGVLVSTFGKRGEKVDFPAFYSRESGLKSPNVVESAKEAAAIIHASHTLGLTSGQFFANPIPAKDEIPKEEIAEIINTAVEMARKDGATGKDNTPYILDRIKTDSKGRSIKANRALILNNARVGAEVAVALSELERKENKNKDQINIVHERSTESTSFLEKQNSKTQDHPSPAQSPIPPATNPVQTSPSLLVIGGIAVDISCDYLPPSNSPLTTTPTLHTSNPSRISESLGGVANNVFTSANLYLNTSTPLTPPEFPIRLISTLSPDLAGKSVLHELTTRGIDVSGILVPPTAELGTPRYVSVNTSTGDLYISAADMALIEKSLTAEYVISEIERAGPELEVVVLDGNLSAAAIAEVLEYGRKKKINIIFEPTSSAKAVRILPASLSPSTTTYTSPSSTSLPPLTFPTTPLLLTTPNTHELSALYTHYSTSLTTHPTHPHAEAWFDVIDALALDATFRNKVEFLFTTTVAESRVRDLVLGEGVIQKAIKLAPYVAHQLVKLGELGVVSVCLLDEMPRWEGSWMGVVHRGSSTTGRVAVRIMYHPPAERVPEAEVVSVNGVGDTFLGVVCGRIVERGVGGAVRETRGLVETVGVAQRAAVGTLRCREAVGGGVGGLRLGLGGRK
ncbi:Indigoidine synthase A like protein-domain-containing protein [Peziza echinospora]|nr:Indigoidine synthase A like protein-domain-containing protein [Peziza echinospora]